MFISFEGGEGGGKTLQSALLADWLKSAGHEVVLTREPGGTSIGGKIRAVLLDPDHSEMTATSELLLYNADRAQHIAQVIRPAMEKNALVICDRYIDATIAYQGVARGLSRKRVLEWHQKACGGLMPDKTFLFDLPAATGLHRAADALAKGDRQPDQTRFEAESLAFHNQVRDAYLQLAHDDPDRIVIIDASQSVSDVQAELQNQMKKIFPDLN